MFERTRCTRPYAPTRLQAINWRGISVAIVDENYGLPENAMDDAETKTKRNRVATDQSAAFLCKVGAAGDWNGRGSIGIDQTRGSIVALVPETLRYCSTFHAARDSFDSFPLLSTSSRHFSPSITHVNRHSMLYLSSTFISRLYIADIYFWISWILMTRSRRNLLYSVFRRVLRHLYHLYASTRRIRVHF